MFLIYCMVFKHEIIVTTIYDYHNVYFFIISYLL